jgi:hypothetical protein
MLDAGDGDDDGNIDSGLMLRSSGHAGLVIREK